MQDSAKRVGIGEDGGEPWKIPQVGEYGGAGPSIYTPDPSPKATLNPGTPRVLPQGTGKSAR